jgi:hypothetical protein
VGDTGVDGVVVLEGGRGGVVAAVSRVVAVVVDVDVGSVGNGEQKWHHFFVWVRKCDQMVRAQPQHI